MNSLKNCNGVIKWLPIATNRWVLIKCKKALAILVPEGWLSCLSFTAELTLPFKVYCRTLSHKLVTYILRLISHSNIVITNQIHLVYISDCNKTWFFSQSFHLFHGQTLLYLLTPSKFLWDDESWARTAESCMCTLILSACINMY